MSTLFSLLPDDVIGLVIKTLQLFDIVKLYENNNDIKNYCKKHKILEKRIVERSKLDVIDYGEETLLNLAKWEQNNSGELKINKNYKKIKTICGEEHTEIIKLKHSGDVFYKNTQLKIINTVNKNLISMHCINEGTYSFILLNTDGKLYQTKSGYSPEISVIPLTIIDEKIVKMCKLYDYNKGSYFLLLAKNGILYKIKTKYLNFELGMINKKMKIFKENIINIFETGPYAVCTNSLNEAFIYGGNINCKNNVNIQIPSVCINAQGLMYNDFYVIILLFENSIKLLAMNQISENIEVNEIELYFNFDKMILYDRIVGLYLNDEIFDIVIKLVYVYNDVIKEHLLFGKNDLHDLLTAVY